MDNVLSIIAIVVSLGTAVIAIVNHTRIRSTCCGRKAEASLDIEKTTPPPTHLPPISIPLLK